VLDAIYCSELGLPSSVVITTPFQTLARYTCKSMGQPDFSVLVAEHPVWTRDDAWIEAAADKLAEQTIDIVGKSSSVCEGN
jgi:hypothetical protein